ncbi:S8 family peptidase [Nonomuraea sp. NPDC050790]|uniref:S8 family peptidase n=1 Tax=Nonomuraea sp. NPDC050790 TaxID=3364371 RepID=UPI0037A39529
MMRRVLTLAVILAAMAGCASPEPDPLEPQQWGLPAVNLPEAWSKADGDGVVIAIVDTGVDTGHPDLKGKIVDGYDFVDGDQDPQDRNGHGTHVAGIAAAVTHNGLGIAGAAPGAKIMPVRVLGAVGSGDQATIVKGIVWAADNGAKVINLSLGETGLISRLLKGGALNPAILHAYSRGAVVVAAAGNEGTVKQPYKPATQVLVVGASDQQGKPAEFSNFGAEDAVSAPGVRIMSTLPTYPTPETRKNATGYGQLDGTSMAAPYVAGLAALLIGQGKTPDQTMRAIRQTARNPTKDLRLGLGVVDARAAVAR